MTLTDYICTFFSRHHYRQQLRSTMYHWRLVFEKCEFSWARALMGGLSGLFFRLLLSIFKIRNILLAIIKILLHWNPSSRKGPQTKNSYLTDLCPKTPCETPKSLFFVFFFIFLYISIVYFLREKILLHGFARINKPIVCPQGQSSKSKYEMN